MSVCLRFGALLMLALVSACQSTPGTRALALPSASLDIRTLQTRRFEGTEESALLSASAGVLQDLGFQIDESEVDLGLIVASKRESASDPGVERLVKLLDIFADVEVAVDRDQRIRVSLVTRPVRGEERQFHVRITFQRVVWNTENDITKRQSLDEPVLYQEFFDRLSKSIFLEAHSI